MVVGLLFSGCEGASSAVAPAMTPEPSVEPSSQAPTLSTAGQDAIDECEQDAQSALHLDPDILFYEEMSANDLGDAGVIVSGYVNKLELSCSYDADGKVVWLKIGGIDYTDRDGDGTPDDEE